MWYTKYDNRRKEVTAGMHITGIGLDVDDMIFGERRGIVSER